MAILPRFIGLLSLALALVTAAPAAAKPAPVGIGLFAPDLGFTPYELFDEIDRVARHISAELGSPVVGRGYKGARELVADIRAGKIQLAVVGGFYLASMRGVVKLLAMGDAGEARARRWTLLASKKREIATVKGQILQLPKLAPRVVDFVQHGLLGSNVKPRKYFKIVESPGLFSAVEAVRIGAAAAVLAPVGTKGLVPLLGNSLAVPPPALVLVSDALPDSVVAKVTRAALSYRGKTKALGGFVRGELATYRSFASNRRPRRFPMLPAVSRPFRLDEEGWLNRDHGGALELPELPLRRLFLTARAR